MRDRSIRVTFLFIAVILSLSTMLYSPQTAEARRLAEVGGFGIIIDDSPSFEYGSLDSEVNGTVNQGEIVYIRGWQIGVYYIGENRWIADEAVQPIINSRGQPMIDSVWKQGNTYYMDGEVLNLPDENQSKADLFLASPDAPAPVIYKGSNVPTDWVGELVDTSTVWYSPRIPVVATMRVTDLYDFIWLYTAPNLNSPLAHYVAYNDDILTAYEVEGDWYRISENVWAPATWGDEILLIEEPAEVYAPDEYYNGGKWISIDLNNQHMTAWEGDDVIVNAPVKSGKFGWHTPTGHYTIYEKVPNERMSGPDYDLMDVAWTQYFTRSRIAIHAAYWHYNYDGRPGSHGCINTPEDIARMLFMWSPVGTKVVTHNPYIFDEQDIADANKWSDFSN